MLLNNYVMYYGMLEVENSECDCANIRKNHMINDIQIIYGTLSTN